MLGIKKQLIKSMIKLEVVKNVPGNLQIYVSQIKKADDQYKCYQVYAEKGIELLNGITHLAVDYPKGIVTIEYDQNAVTAKKIYTWLNKIVDLGVDYYDDLKPIWEGEGTDDQKVELIWQKVKPVLVNALNKL